MCHRTTAVSTNPTVVGELVHSIQYCNPSGCLTIVRFKPYVYLELYLRLEINQHKCCLLITTNLAGVAFDIFKRDLEQSKAIQLLVS